MWAGPCTLRVLIVCLVAAGSVGFGPQAGSACASNNHLRAKLDAFTVNAGLQSFFATTESASPVTARIRNVGDDCIGQLLTVAYATKDITATGNADYTPASGQTPPLNDDPHPEDDLSAPTFYDVAIPVVADADQPVVESAQFGMSVPVGGAVIEPSSVPVYIVDDSGATRIGLDSYPYAQTESIADARVPVFRGGDASGVMGVSYSFAPGTQNPAAAGTDFLGTPGSVTFQAGERWALIPFTIVEDSGAEPPETLQISIQGTGVVPTASTTTLTILDNEEAIAPSSKLHHPRHRWRYPYNDYRLREIHVFTKDELGGSGVVAVDLALRRKLLSGKCGWWNGKRFRAGDCSEKLWRRTKVYEPGYFYYARMKAIGPSVGTNVMNYTAYARAIDGAGNVESLLKLRRNRNTFEVKRKG
jgi:Calx-beta domain